MDATPAKLRERGPLDDVFRSLTTHDAKRLKDQTVGRKKLPVQRKRRRRRMRATLAVFKREFVAYFATPLAYVFIVIFLFAMGAFTFYIGHFYENGAPT